jgi:hypothetical protein
MVGLEPTTSRVKSDNPHQRPVHGSVYQTRGRPSILILQPLGNHIRRGAISLQRRVVWIRAIHACRINSKDTPPDASAMGVATMCVRDRSSQCLALHLAGIKTPTEGVGVILRRTKTLTPHEESQSPTTVHHSVDRMMKHSNFRANRLTL